MQHHLFVLFLLFIASPWMVWTLDSGIRQNQASPQQDTCSSSEAHQFDFWIGQWNIDQKILQADGSWLKLPATTTVSPALNGCALIEHWEGQVLFFWDGMKEVNLLKGLSVRSYDPKLGKWVIYWMDTQTHRFGEFEGRFKDGRGDFFRSTTTADGKSLLSRITFSGITATKVNWELAISPNNGKSWQPIWMMEMMRKE